MRLRGWLLGLVLLLLLAVPFTLPPAEPARIPVRQVAPTVPPAVVPAEPAAPTDRMNRPAGSTSVRVQVLPARRSAPPPPPPAADPALPATGSGWRALLLAVAAVLLALFGVVALVLAAEPRYLYRARHLQR